MVDVNSSSTLTKNHVRRCLRDIFHPDVKKDTLLLLEGPSSSSGKELGYGLDGLGFIPGVEGVEIFLHSFVSRPVLVFTQPPIK